MKYLLLILILVFLSACAPIFEPQTIDEFPGMMSNKIIYSNIAYVKDFNNQVFLPWRD